MFEVGRICVKTAGREAGRYCVIVKKIDDNFVLITGPRPIINVRRRKCNIQHLEPLPEKIEIKEGASDIDVFKAYEKADIFSKLNIPKPKKDIIEALQKEEKPKKEEKGKEKVTKKEKTKQKKTKAKKETKKSKETSKQ